MAPHKAAKKAPQKTANKAAHKVAKKAAKKAPAKSAAHKEMHDARRTFEHLGRVQALATLTSAQHTAIHTLTSAAEKALKSSLYKESADLLRAAEHLSFAAIAETDPARVSPELTRAIRDEVAQLAERAEEHGAAEDAPESIRAIYTRMSTDAAKKLHQGAYHAALELARGAEALTHLHHLNDKLLSAGDSDRRLKD